MLTDPKLKSQVDQLWDKFWSGGLTNPLDAIEQFSYLLFLKRLDDGENAPPAQAERAGAGLHPAHASRNALGVLDQPGSDDSAQAPERSHLPLVPHAG